MKEILSYLGQEFTVEKVSEAKTRVINKRGLFAIIEKSNETTYSVECDGVGLRWAESYEEALEFAPEMIVKKEESLRAYR